MLLYKLSSLFLRLVTHTLRGKTRFLFSLSFYTDTTDIDIDDRDRLFVLCPLSPPTWSVAPSDILGKVTQDKTKKT